MKSDEFEIHPIRDGYFYLDGGAMFGIVPKPVWQKTNNPDYLNRIRLSLTVLLIKIQGKYILVDTGIGNRYDEQFTEMYNIQKEDNLPSKLERLGLKSDEINYVILTHLHFDHCGGNTIIKNGKLVPTFENAKYIVQAKAWEEALNPNERTRASYRSDDFVPLESFGNLTLVDGDCEVLPGVKVILTGGHTKGHQIVLIEHNNRTHVYFGDLIPTTTHIRLPFIMAYDLYPLETLQMKKKFLDEAVRNDWLCYFEHDPQIISGYIRKREKYYEIEAIE